MAQLRCVIEEASSTRSLPTINGNSYDIWLLEEFDGSYYYHDDIKKDWEEAIEWCRDQFGPAGPRWQGMVSSSLRNYVCFIDRDDAFAFKIRWC